MKNKADGFWTMVFERPYMTRYGVRMRPQGQRPLYGVIAKMIAELDSTAKMTRTA